MTPDPVRIRPAERSLARVIVVLFLGGVAAAVLPVVADPVTAAIGSLAPDETADEAPNPLPPVVVVPETAPPPALPSAVPPPPAPAEAPPEVEAVVAEAPATTAPPTTAPPTTTTTAVPGSVPPPAGTYPYRLRYEDEHESMEASGRMVVQAAREVEGETRQAHVYTDEVYGTLSEAYAWRGDGVYVRFVDDGSGAESNSCDFEPDILAYPLPLTVGHKWKVDSVCANDDGADRYEASSEIVRSDRIPIGGQEVDVVVIRNTGENVYEEFRREFVETVYFAPSVGLTVRTEVDQSIYEEGELVLAFREKYELKTLDPD